MRIILTIILALLFEPPSLAVVPSVDTVYPGQLFSVTITQFGDVGDVTFDSGGLEIITDTATLPTRTLWLRAAGVPRDVRLRAWGAGVVSEATIRVCCLEAVAPVDPTRRVYLAIFRG